MKNLSVFTLLFIIGATFLFSCGSPSNNEAILSTLDEFQKEFVPDKRIAVFNVIQSETSDSITVETTSQNAKSAIEEFLTSNNSDNITVKLLPDSVLGDDQFAVVRVSVANLRRDPRHQAEMIDQAIMGTRLKVLKRQRGWYYIQTPWEYLGWITSGSLEIMDETALNDSWSPDELVYVNSVDTRVFDSANTNSGVVSDVTLGATLRFIETSGLYAKVALPDGREGYIRATEIQPFAESDPTNGLDREALITTANRFHGLPYLWGGNSGKGFDCSGFTQTVFKNHGILLPRDANMQVEMGTTVEFADNFTNVQKGDLLFFGPNRNRITHVGISLGGGKFIHSSSYVQINSLNPDDSDYDEGRRNSLQVIKRI
ncbi:MAG TPA: hypothetical protein DCE78_11465 [Bacteroidetes bacterium]|nr:hypothetical protein [Bacteroidota bacterium]